MCPRCYSDKRKIVKSVKKDGYVARECICIECELPYQTKEKVATVSIYNQRTLKSDRIPLSKYQDNYINTN